MEIKIPNSSEAVEKIATNIAPQLRLREKEKKLQEFIKDIPITIKYGCHTIELKETDNSFNGFSFEVKKEKGKGVVINIT